MMRVIRTGETARFWQHFATRHRPFRGLRRRSSLIHLMRWVGICLVHDLIASKDPLV